MTRPRIPNTTGHIVERNLPTRVARRNISRAPSVRYVTVMRPSKWGNPFTVSKYGRPEAIARYIMLLAAMPHFYAPIRQYLRGATLLCCCHDRHTPFADLRAGRDPGCHADVLAYVADGGNASDMMWYVNKVMK